MIPNKERKTKQRRRSLRKVDRFIGQLRRDARTMAKEAGYPKASPAVAMTEGRAQKSVSGGPLAFAQAKASETKVEATKPPVVLKQLDPETARTHVTLLKEKLKLSPERKVTRSYLECACMYKGIKLTSAQKEAIGIVYRETETF